MRPKNPKYNNNKKRRCWRRRRSDFRPCCFLSVGRGRSTSNIIFFFPGINSITNMNNNKIFEALHALPALSSSSSSSISWCVIIQVLCWDPLQLRRRRRTARVSLSFVASFASPWVVRWAPAESKAIGPMSRQTPPTSPLLLLCVFFFSLSDDDMTVTYAVRWAHTHTPPLRPFSYFPFSSIGYWWWPLYYETKT